MSIFLEITQLENGDIVLREADDETEQTEPLGPGQTMLDAGQPDNLGTDQDPGEDEASGQRRAADSPAWHDGTVSRASGPDQFFRRGARYARW